MANILIVEDSEPIQQLYKHVMEGMKHSVLIKSTAEDALEMYCGCGGCFDMIILDLMLPGMSGEKFLMTLWQMGIEPKVLVSTAKDYEDVSMLEKASPRVKILLKPFDFKQLRDSVDEVLNGR
jgi:DNA-binding response OmpR family regulator